jgi:hypothetical protein
MRYILPPNAFEKLTSLKSQYEKQKQIKLDDKPSIIGMPTMFGGVDVESRRSQINFIEKVLTVLRPNLKPTQELLSPDDLASLTAASRLCLVSCLYVQSQNSKKSVLTRVINSALGITDENFPDEFDKEECYATARRLINVKGAFEEANSVLRKAKLNPFSEKEWSKFSDHVNTTLVKKDLTAPITSYPITSLTKPLFKSTFSYAGATFGLIGGDMISQSTKAMSSQFQLTASIGSGLLILGSAGPAGIALFAPIIATKLINNFCSITLAHILGLSMGLLGEGLGTVVGLPLDLAYRLLWKVCAVVGGILIREPHNPSITGLRIADGAMVIGGLAIELTPVDKLPKDVKCIQINEDGSMYLNGKAIMAPSSKTQLPSEVLDELRSQLKICTEEPFPGVSQKIAELPTIEENDEIAEEVTEDASEEESSLPSPA